MTVFLAPAIKLFSLFPGMLLAYLPVKNALLYPPRKLALRIIPAFILLCFAGGWSAAFFSFNISWFHFLIIMIFCIFYVHSLCMTRWKSVSVFLAVCGTFSCLNQMAEILSRLLFSGSINLPLCTALIYHLMCWIFVALAWYPASHQARKLLEDDSFARTWYAFWIIPLLFIGLNLMMSPLWQGSLPKSQLMALSLAGIFFLLLLLLLFYLLFYLMASSLNRNDHLRQENQFLAMQQAQYQNLNAAIAETRRARHDMRHHVSILKEFSEHQEWESLKNYISELWDELPSARLNLCHNIAADGVVSHYAALFEKHQIPFSAELDLPQDLPVAEMDLCMVLSNLLENALEAGRRTRTARRYLKMQAYLHSDSVILMTVENAYDGTVKEKDGVFQSSKRPGEGIGLQSVRHIAEKNGGYCNFLYDQGVFLAQVMLRGTDKNQEGNVAK